MGIQDRDYMKRRPDEEPSRNYSAENNLDRLATNLLGKHRRWVLGAVIGIAVLIVLGLILGMM